MPVDRRPMRAVGFAGLTTQPADPLLAVGEAFRADPRRHKIDLGLGVYRNEAGETPVMRAVKGAESRLLETETTKAYVGAAGDLAFVDLLKGFVFGADLVPKVVAGLQTTGGTAALRLAADLLARAGVRRIHVGRPGWANHLPILHAAGLEALEHDQFDTAVQRIDFDSVVSALERAGAGDAVLVQAACHNPTGADFTLEQWRALADVAQRRSLIPIVDVAYPGMGQNLESDMAGARVLIAAVPQAFVAVSCSKTFGLYRERTGALFGVADGHGAAVQSNLLALARANYSMPPNHGAAVVRLVLEDPLLRDLWESELERMCLRIRALRQRLGSHGQAGRIDLSPLAGQHGMFSQLALSGPDIQRLRDDYAIYVAPGGRVNLAGLRGADLERFLAGLRAVAT
jgi:aromatic-amino-acid transaminase